MRILAIRSSDRRSHRRATASGIRQIDEPASCRSVFVNRRVTKPRYRVNLTSVSSALESGFPLGRHRAGRPSCREGHGMKLVVAVIKPHQVEAVTDALHAIDVNGVTVTEARGHGRQRGHSEVYRGGEYRVTYLPKVEVKVLASDDQVEKVAATIADAARTGKIGDGKLWVIPVETAMRIRTGEV